MRQCLPSIPNLQSATGASCQAYPLCMKDDCDEYYVMLEAQASMRTFQSDCIMTARSKCP